MRLTPTQVSPVAAAIALAAPRPTSTRWPSSAGWDRYRDALDVVAAAGSPDGAADRRKQAEAHAAEVRVLYADLISQVRKELKQGKDPWWRRWRPTRGRRVSSGEEPAAGARPV